MSKHKDDGTCHGKCWKQAMAEFEAAQKARRVATRPPTEDEIENEGFQPNAKIAATL